MKRSDIHEASELLMKLDQLKHESARVSKLREAALDASVDHCSVIIFGSCVTLTRGYMIKLLDGVLDDVEAKTDVVKQRLQNIGVED